MTVTSANNKGLSVQTHGNTSVTDKRTLQLTHPHAPLFVDVWPARQPSGAAPIMLVHGWGGSGSYWETMALALSETTQVYVPDLPGTGRSRPVSKPQNLYDQVNALKTVLDETGLDKVQLIGHSMGSAMSLLLAADRPEQIDRLVLTSMCFFLTDEQVQIYNSVMKFIKLTMRFRAPWMVDIPGLTRVMASRYFYRIPNDHQLLRQGLQEYLDLDFDTAVACANNAADTAIPTAGAAIQMPTLLIACRQDQVMPIENVNYTAETIPNCQVQWINHCGHLPMVEKPREYLQILRGFLQL